jgi:hypothetical protein
MRCMGLKEHRSMLHLEVLIQLITFGVVVLVRLNT